MEGKANMIEEFRFKSKKRKHCGSSKDNGKENDPKWFKGDFYNCEKPGH